MKGTEDRFLSAVQRGNLEDVQEIYESTVDKAELLKCCHKKSGDRAIHLAARNNYVDVLEYIIAKGADIESGNLDGKRALHESAQTGSLECLNLLLLKGAEVDALKRADWLMQLLYNTAYFLNLLLLKGAEVDALKKADWTPLHLACTKLDAVIVARLLSGGANPSLCNKDGWNAFHIANREGSTDVLNCLLDNNLSLWSTKSKNGRTPLHTAALHGQLDAVHLLLERCKYSPDAADSCGSTPLMDALRAGFTDVADVLISMHKAGVRRPDVLGREPLHITAQAGCEKSVKYLIQTHKVPPDVTTSIGGLTPLHLAAKEGQDGIIITLLQLGATVNAKDVKGRTALHIAAASQMVQCVKVLLKSGADICKDQDGNRPSDVTKKKEITDLLEAT